MPNSPDLTAAQVMDNAASLLNDTAKSIYSYTAQIPYLNMALRELQEYFELNEVPVTDTISAIMTVPAATAFIGFNTVGLRLPSDLIEPQILWERTSGVNPYTQMSKVDSLPQSEFGIPISQFLFYVWQAQELRFLAANLDIDIKMDYIRNIFATVTSSSDQLNVINGQSFLQYRTASLCAEFIGENPTRAQSLNGDASLALDRVVGIGTKGRQAINVRHRPFRSAYKRRGY